MPRITRSQAAALQNADSREPLEEVTENIKLPEPVRRSTRARSKAGTRKENYSTEERPAPAIDGAEIGSHCAGTSVLNRSVRVTRSQATKAPDVIVLDEIETIEVTTTRRTRSTRRTRQTAIEADIERHPEEVVAVVPPAPMVRGRRAERDSLGAPSKLSPSKIPSPVRPHPSQVSKPDETPSKLASAGLFAKGPSPASVSRSTSRLAKKAVREDPQAGKPAVKPFAAKLAAAEQPEELPLPVAISTPLIDRCAPDMAPGAFGLPTPFDFAALTPKSKLVFTPATTKNKKPVVLGSPFTSSPTRKVVPKVPSLGSFASPTKAQLARKSIAPPKFGPQAGNPGNKSAIVSVSQTRLEKEQPPVSGSVGQDTMKQKAAPSVLLKKLPVIATTKAALLRTQKATGRVAEPTVRVVSQNTDEVKASTSQGPNDAAVPMPTKAVNQKTEPRKPIPPAQNRPGVIAPNKSAPVRSPVKAQDKATIETAAKTAPRPLPRVATISSQPRREDAPNAKPQQPVTPGRSIVEIKSQASSLLKKPSIPALPKVQATILSKKPSVPTLSRVTTTMTTPSKKPSVLELTRPTTTPSKKPSVLELTRPTTTPSKKPSMPTLPRVQAPALSKKPSIPTLPTAATLAKKPSMSTLPKTTTDLSRKPSIPTLSRAATTLSKKPSIPTLTKATVTLSKKPSIPSLPKPAASVPTNAPAPTPAVDNPKAEEAKPKESEPVKAAKFVTPKKPFVPVKSTKPLTVPIPFQYDPGNRTARPSVQPKAPVPQPTAPRTSAAVGIKDRMKKFEAPKPKPVVMKDARTMLREMRKEARLGTLPALTGEVVYAELPKVDDLTVATPAPPQEPEVEAHVPEPFVATVLAVPGGIPLAASPDEEISPKTIPTPKPSTHESVVISGIAPASPEKTVPLEDFQKLKLAKDRAEAYARGTNAVLNWAAQEMVKQNSEAARRR
ncbi:hypothetical protein TWF481_004755 [Arthrobotrys musiformis]|uniref:Uncharacterized protein n=1 Tax=Arthrobotrys musiformis TaxID=47236 RepID=A0AAV9WKH2_9PEZI